MANDVFLVARKGVDLVSASNILPLLNYDRVDITGTSNISTISTTGRGIGARFWGRFVNACPVTNNTASLILLNNLPNGAIYTTVAGEMMLFEVTGTNTVRQLPGAMFDTFRAPVAKSATYTLTDSDYHILVSGTSFTTTLPTAVGRAGRRYRLTQTQATSASNLYTVATTSAQTIGGLTTRKLGTLGSTIEVESDGANWIITDHQIPGVIPITYAATITPDCLLIDRYRGSTMECTLAGNVTIAAPTSPSDGNRLRLRLIYAGANTVTWNAVFAWNVTWPSPTVSTAAGKIDEWEFEYRATGTKWIPIAQSIGS